MVIGWHIPEKGWPDQAESASKELTAGVGLYKSHQTKLEAWSQAISWERQPIIAPYVPAPQQAFLTSSNPIFVTEMHIILSN